MSSPNTTTQEQRRRAAIRHGLAQVRIESMEPSPLFFELAERYIRGEITIEEAIAALKQEVQVHS